MWDTKSKQVVCKNELTVDTMNALIQIKLLPASILCPNVTLHLFSILSPELVCDKKLLNTELSSRGYHCWWVLLSAGICPLLSLLSSLSALCCFSLPEWTQLFYFEHLYSCLSASLSSLLCASVVQSVCISWPHPHYRHNTAAAGCLSHSHTVVDTSFFPLPST